MGYEIRRRGCGGGVGAGCRCGRLLEGLCRGWRGGRRERRGGGRWGLCRWGGGCR